ncbi:MAG: DUF3333 domain-containing protein, partial [Nitratireductor sp.]
MSDTTARPGEPKRGVWYEPDAKLRRRHAADKRLRAYGIAAIVFALAMLATLVGTIAITAAPAVTQTMVTLEVVVPEGAVDPTDPRGGSYQKILNESIARIFPDVDAPRELRELRQLFSNGG